MATGLTLALRLGSEYDEVIPFGGGSSTYDWKFEIYNLTTTQWEEVAVIASNIAEFESAGTNRLRWLPGQTLEVTNTSGDSITYSQWSLSLDEAQYTGPAVVIPETGFGETGTEEIVLGDEQKLTITEVILEVVS